MCALKNISTYFILFQSLPVSGCGNGLKFGFITQKKMYARAHTHTQNYNYLHQQMATQHNVIMLTEMGVKEQKDVDCTFIESRSLSASC